MKKELYIDQNLSDAYNSLACTKLVFDWNWLGAQSEFKRAIELNPGYAVAHHWYAECLAGMGRYDEALAEIKRAQESDPLSLIISAVVGWILYFNRQHDQAIGQFQKAIEADPHFPEAH